jgi:hypothetical protein
VTAMSAVGASKYLRFGSVCWPLGFVLFFLLSASTGFAADPQGKKEAGNSGEGAGEAVVRVQSDEGSDVVRNQSLMHTGRHAVTPVVGLSFNHPYLHQASLGLRYDYFLSNWAALGLDLGYTMATENSLGSNITTVRKDFETSTFGFHALASAMLIPFQGKFLWLTPPSFRYDIFLRFAGGMIQLKGTDDKIPAEYTVAPRFGMGTHLYFGEQVSLVLEVHDTLVSLHPSTSRDGAVLAKNLHNIFALNVGVLFHFPEGNEVGR